MVGNVGLWPAKTFVWTRVKQDLRCGGPLEMLSTAKPIRIKVQRHQFSLLIFNFRYIFLFTVFLRDRGIAGIREMPHYSQPKGSEGRKEGKQQNKTRRCGSFLSSTLFTLYESFAWQIFASLGLFTFARIACLLQLLIKTSDIDYTI